MTKFVNFLPLTLVLIATVAMAQTPPGAADVIRSTKEKPEPPTQGEPVLPNYKADERPAMAIGADLKVKVSAFNITGNTAIDSATLKAAVAGDIGIELDAAGLAAAAKKVRRVYTSRGYFLAVAYLPQQQIKEDGVVEIVVLEGRLGEIKVSVAPDARISESQARAIINAHLKPGDLITEASIERPLLLIRDMAGLDAKSTIDPGQQIGTADLSVMVVPEHSGRIVSGSVDIDDYGNRFAGEHQVGALITVNGPLRRGDRLSVRAQVAEETSTNVASVSYILPVGPYGTKIALSAVQLKYKLGRTEFSAAGAHGDASIYGINVIHPVIRRREANMLVRVGYEETTTRDFLKALSGSDHKEIPAVTLELSGDLFDTHKGYTFGSLTFVSGTTKFLNSSLGFTDGLSGKTAGNFSKTSWSIERSQQLPANFYLELSASGQVASKNLTPLEKFTLGGPTAVRAYPVGDAPGDNGELYSIELRHAVPKYTLFGSAMTASLFYDGGMVEQNERPADFLTPATPNRLRRGGYGLGLSVGTRDNFLFKLSVAWPDSGTPATSQNDRASRDPRVYFSALKSF